jgi:hypothetical protein
MSMSRVAMMFLHHGYRGQKGKPGGVLAKRADCWLIPDSGDEISSRRPRTAWLLTSG